MKNKTKILIAAPILLVLLYFGFNATRGPIFIIETNKSAEDFVAVCKWTGESLLFGSHGSGYAQLGHKVFVTESGKEIDCGINFRGGDGSVIIYHPVYVKAGFSNRASAKDKAKVKIINGVKHIVMNKSKLDVLEEKKAKFEAGYWDKLPAPGWAKDKTPEQRYARSIGGCGLGGVYLDYYSRVKKANRNYFMKKYNDFLFECNNMAYKEKFVNDPSLKGDVLGIEKKMKLIWDDEKWRKYEK